MLTLEELMEKPIDQRTAIEGCIVRATLLEDQRDGDYEVMELAVAELNHLRARRIEDTLTEEIADRIVDDLFMDGGLKKEATRLVMEHHSRQLGGSGWAKVPARNVILRVIRETLKEQK